MSYDTVYNVLYSNIYLLIITCVFSAAVCVLAIVAMWLLFEKAGEGGWKAIIPIYNLYTLFKLAWNEKTFWEVFICAVCMSIIYAVLVNFGYNIGDFVIFLWVCNCLLGIWILIDIIVLCTQIAFAYGRGWGFAIGMVFLTLIFICILAFGKSKYVGNPSEENTKIKIPSK